jgi:hypothetical protein
MYVFHSGTGEGEKYDLFFTLEWVRGCYGTPLSFIYFGTTCYVSVPFEKEYTGQTCPFVLSDVAEIEKVWML